MNEPSPNTAVMNIDYENGGYDRRSQSRYTSEQKLWLITYEVSNGKSVAKYIKWKTMDVSVNGMMVKTGNYPLVPGQAVNVCLILTITEIITRIHLLKGHVRYSKDGITGFTFSKRK